MARARNYNEPSPLPSPLPSQYQSADSGLVA